MRRRPPGGKIATRTSPPRRERLFYAMVIPATGPRLFEAFTVRSVTLRNRVGVSPMCQYSSEDGLPSDWHLVHLGARAIGGAGLVIAEATAVEADGRISPADAGLWNDGQIEPLRRITDFLKQHGAVPGIQLAHAGRKASSAVPWQGGHHLGADEGGWETIAPSAIAFGGRLTKVPRAMDKSEIERVTRSFAASAARAKEAGYQWLELHAAHGYLISEFLSPLSNHRDDEYGGSFENRTRFLLETVQAVRQVWPEKYPLAVRLSCSDWFPGGWDIGDSVELSRRLRDEAVDLIDCSSGGTVHEQQIPVGPGYQVPFAEAIRREAGIATAAVGLITDPRQAEEIVASGKADMVLMAREMLRDPNWPLRASRLLGAGDPVAPPSQYGRAW